MPLFDEIENDERLHLRDRGMGRDIGRNPAFDGHKPITRNDSRKRRVAGLDSVGMFGSREETLTSYAATAIGFDLAPGRQDITNGAGAFHGLSVLYTEAAPAPNSHVIVLVWTGTTKIASVVALPNQSANLVLPQGVNIDGLSVQVIPAASVAYNVIHAAAWVATVE